MRLRHLEPSLLRALADTPVVLINGARQVGKTTLVRRLPGRRYLNLDDATVLGVRIRWSRTAAF